MIFTCQLTPYNNLLMLLSLETKEKQKRNERERKERKKDELKRIRIFESPSTMVTRWAETNFENFEILV